MTTLDKPYTLTTEHSELAKRARSEGRFLCAYSCRGDADEIDRPIESHEIVVHVDCGEGVNVYALSDVETVT